MVVTSLSSRFLIEILFLQDYLFSYFWNFVSHFGYFFFALFPFSSEINFEIFSYLRSKILFSEMMFLYENSSVIKLFCWDYNSIQYLICQYYLHISFELFYIIIYISKLSEYLNFYILLRQLKTLTKITAWRRGILPRWHAVLALY